MKLVLPLLILLILPLPAHAQAVFKASRLMSAAVAQVDVTTGYDGTYRSIAYPGGDVPLATGVCTDVVIRGYRALGFDLQKLVHEDMRKHFALYPKTWGLKNPDTNIDHRRVPNLQVFFSRHGKRLGVSTNPTAYLPGDLVTWNLRGSANPLPHIGIVTDRKAPGGLRPLIVHNIGNGAQVEDTLFAFTITGHYRYAPSDP